MALEGASAFLQTSVNEFVLCIQIAAAPGGFSVCLQTSYKALMLNYIEVLLMKVCMYQAACL